MVNARHYRDDDSWSDDSLSTGSEYSRGSEAYIRKTENDLDANLSIIEDAMSAKKKNTIIRNLGKLVW